MRVCLIVLTFSFVVFSACKAPTKSDSPGAASGGARVSLEEDWLLAGDKETAYFVSTLALRDELEASLEEESAHLSLAAGRISLGAEAKEAVQSSKKSKDYAPIENAADDVARTMRKFMDFESIKGLRASSTRLHSVIGDDVDTAVLDIMHFKGDIDKALAALGRLRFKNLEIRGSLDGLQMKTLMSRLKVDENGLTFKIKVPPNEEGLQSFAEELRKLNNNKIKVELSVSPKGFKNVGEIPGLTAIEVSQINKSNYDFINRPEDWRDSTVTEFNAFLLANKDIEKLNLSSVSMSFNSPSSLRGAWTISDRVRADFFETLGQINNLRDLNLATWTIDRQTGPLFARALEGKTLLTDLNLSQTSINPEAMVALAPSINRLTKLESLSFRNVEALLGRQSVGGVFSGASALAIAFKGGPIGNTATVLPPMVGLRKLDLSGTLIDSRHMNALKVGLKELTGLKELNLSGSRLSDEGTEGAAHLNEVLLGTTNLEKLSLNQVTMSAAKDIAPGLKGLTSLKELHLLSTRFKSDSSDALIDALAGKSLTTLSLGNSEFSSTALAGFAKWVGSNPKLESLTLKSCQLGDSGLAAIAPALAESKSLKSLDLSYNGLTSDLSLGEILSKNTSIRDLNISDNRLATADALKKGLEENTKLKSFIFDKYAHSDIAWPGQGAVLASVSEGLAANKSLVAIKLDQPTTGYSEATLNNLKTAVTRNPALKSMNLGDSCFTKSLAGISASFTELETAAAAKKILFKGCIR